MLAVIAAIAEPSRFEIVEYLKGGPRSVNEIALRLGLRQPQASKHLRVLSEAGILRKRSQAQLRIYELEPRAFAELGSWVGSFSSLWNARLDSLDGFLKELSSSGRKTQAPRREGAGGRRTHG